MKKGNIQGNWKEGNKNVEMNLPIMLFEDSGCKIAYIPVLDLCGYGGNDEEAIESLKVVISEYLTYTVRKNTLIEDLKAHGWTVKKRSKPYVAPDITDLINKNEYLHDIVNKKPYSMKRMPVNIPQYA